VRSLAITLEDQCIYLSNKILGCTPINRTDGYQTLSNWWAGVQFLRDHATEAYSHVFFLIFSCWIFMSRKKFGRLSLTFVHCNDPVCRDVNNLTGASKHSGSHDTAMSSSSWHFGESLAQCSEFSFPMKTEPGIATEEPEGN
jgi:hypothetical protein